MVLSFETWEWRNFKNILELRNLFVGELLRIYPNIDFNYYYSSDFLSEFSKFIYDTSSGKTEEVNVGKDLDDIIPPKYTSTYNKYYRFKYENNLLNEKT